MEDACISISASAGWETVTWVAILALGWFVLKVNE
jgi:hypothetical protein